MRKSVSVGGEFRIGKVNEEEMKKSYTLSARTESNQDEIGQGYT